MLRAFDLPRYTTTSSDPLEAFLELAEVLNIGSDYVYRQCLTDIPV